MQSSKTTNLSIFTSRRTLCRHESFFNPDNPYYGVHRKIFDLIPIEPQIFIFSYCFRSSPSVTSTSALFYVTLKMVRGEDPTSGRISGNHSVKNFKTRYTDMDIFHSGLYLSWNGFLHHQFTEYNTVCSDTHAPLVCMSRCIICILYMSFRSSHILCTVQLGVKNAVL